MSGERERGYATVIGDLQDLVARLYCALIEGWGGDQMGVALADAERELTRAQVAHRSITGEAVQSHAVALRRSGAGGGDG